MMKSTNACNASDVTEPNNIVNIPTNIVDTYYALTLKSTYASDSKQTVGKLYTMYKKIIESAYRYKMKSLKHCFEYDSLGRLHMHCLVEGKAKAWIKPVAGYHIHLAGIATFEDKLRWESYMMKDQQTNNPLYFNPDREFII